MGSSTTRVAVDLRVLSTPGADRGMGRFAQQLLRELAQDDRLTLVLLTFPGLRLGVLEASTAAALATTDTVQLPFVPEHHPDSLAGATEYLERLLVLHDVDVYLECTPFLGPSRYDIAVCPTVCVLYDLIPYRLYGDYLAGHAGVQMSYALNIRQVARASHVIAISEYVQDHALTYLGVEKSRTSIVYPALSKDYAALADDIVQQRVQPPVWAPRAIVISGVHRSKNLDHVLEGFRSYREQGGVLELDVVLPFKGAVAMIAARDTLAAGVTLHEDIPDAVKVAMHRSAAVALHASIEEGYGIPLVEGMAASWSVLAVDNILNRELGRDTIDYYTPDSPDALASALLSAEQRLLVPAVKARRARAARVGELAATSTPVADLVLEAAAKTTHRGGVGVVGPLPPCDDCGIAAYAHEVVDALACEVEVAVYVDQDAVPALAERKDIGIRAAGSLELHEPHLDHVFFQLGGAPWFASTFKALAGARATRRTAVVHDVNIGLGFYQIWTRLFGAGDFERAILSYEAEDVQARFRMALRSGREPLIASAMDATPLTAWLSAYADDVVVHAEAVRPLVALARDQVRVAPMPAFAAPRHLPLLAHDFRARWGAAGERLIVCPGTVVGTKRLDVAIRALAQLEEGTVLVLAGPTPDEPLVEGLLELAAREGVEGRLQMTGTLQGGQLYGALAGADIVLAMRNQQRVQVSSVLLRALACGAAVVAERAQGWEDAVDAACVPLPSPPAPGDVAHALRQVLGEPELSKVLKGRARHHAATAADRRAVTAAYLT